MYTNVSMTIPSVTSIFHHMVFKDFNIVSLWKKIQNPKKRFVLCENQYERRKTHITHKQIIEIHLYFHIFHIEILQDGIIFRYALRNASFLFFIFLLIFFSFRHYSNFECLQNVVFYCFNFETKRYQILSSVFSFHLI